MSHGSEVITFIKELEAEASPYPRGAISKVFGKAYSYQFAALLQATFRRGSIVLTAPNLHFAWKDEDGGYYDANGAYTGHLFDIPVECVEEAVCSRLCIREGEGCTDREVRSLFAAFAPNSRMLQQAIEIFENEKGR